MRHRVFILFALSVLCLSAGDAAARQPKLAPSYKAAEVPMVTFTIDWPGDNPNHFAITVESSGRAAYESTSGSTSQTGEPYSTKFIMTPATRDKIFELAKQANYFQGDFDYIKHKVAFTGKKTLAYSDVSHHTQTTYNYSESSPIEEITRIFEGISNTIESGQRLTYLKRFDRLGLAKELQQMQRLATEGQLKQLQTIAPLLQQIASDSAVMDLARDRARKLYKEAESTE